MVKSTSLKNKSENAELTKEALTYYHRESKKRNLDKELYLQISKRAIDQAINLGYISNRMIDAFVSVLNANEDALIGKISLKDVPVSHNISNTQIEINPEILSDDEIIIRLSAGIKLKKFPDDIMMKLNEYAKYLKINFQIK